MLKISRKGNHTGMEESNKGRDSLLQNEHEQVRKTSLGDLPSSGCQKSKKMMRYLPERTIMGGVICSLVLVSVSVQGKKGVQVFT